VRSKAAEEIPESRQVLCRPELMFCQPLTDRFEPLLFEIFHILRSKIGEALGECARLADEGAVGTDDIYYKSACLKCWILNSMISSLTSDTRIKNLVQATDLLHSLDKRASISPHVPNHHFPSRRCLSSLHAYGGP
jgi:hypothetical protein